MRKLFSRGYKSGSGSDADHNYNTGSTVTRILALTSVHDSDIDFYMPDLTSDEIFKTAAPQILTLTTAVTLIPINRIWSC